jgi:hypothetical protein
MKLVANWRRVLKRAWSIRLMIRPAVKLSRTAGVNSRQQRDVNPDARPRSRANGSRVLTGL